MRYVALRPKAVWLADETSMADTLSVTVFEAANEPTPTGVLDANGVEYYRLPERRRLGFDT